MSRDMSGKRNKLFRDRGVQCELCGYTPTHSGVLYVHHIKPIQYGGTNDINNLSIVCEKCHADCHGYTKKNYMDWECEKWHRNIGEVLESLEYKVRCNNA